MTSAAMASAHFIAGDWGTSRLRLSLCDATGDVLAQAEGPGAAACDGRFAEVFANATAGWSGFGPLPAVLCGMVGSRLGWAEAPYLPCPVDPAQIARYTRAIGTTGPRIAPGLACTNRLGTPDFLRGEETQVLGVLDLDARLREGHHCIVLPGTHSKWLHLVDGYVQHFQTLVTGEVFAALREHSVLVTPAASDADDSALERAFLLGVENVKASPPDSLLPQLFECRAQSLAGGLRDGEEIAFLSGLLIGHELRFALAHVVAEPTASLRLVGAPELTERYALALTAFGKEADSLDGSRAAVAGLTEIYRRLAAEEF